MLALSEEVAHDSLLQSRRALEAEAAAKVATEANVVAQVQTRLALVESQLSQALHSLEARYYASLRLRRLNIVPEWEEAERVPDP